MTSPNHKMSHYVHSFGGKAKPPLDKTLLGGKGIGLVEMSSIGLPVPPGFIISTEACNSFLHAGRQFPKGLKEEIDRSMQSLERLVEGQFGNKEHPLLVSVRSGARVSMPGMMDTILNLGLTDETVVGFAHIMNNKRFAYDNYRRFIAMFADIVGGISRKLFEQAFEIIKMEEGVKEGRHVSANGFKKACEIFLKIYQQKNRAAFPQNPYEQLYQAITAVFRSWESERAQLYRQLNHIPDEWGTAVIVQTMVFGNRNDRSATGVGFTRDPASGNNSFYGEFLVDAQGEEVVAGIRTPHPINKYQKEVSKSSLASLEELMPKMYEQLNEAVHLLEQHYKDMQDIEFTIDDNRLFMLQTRNGKRTGFAAVRMAVEMLEEGLIDEKTALKRIQPDQLIQLLAPVFDPKAKKAAADKLVAKGLNAGPGAASGAAIFSSEKAQSYKKRGIPCILVREEANPDDFPGMVAAEGVLTIRGGSTSHAAVVARGMGKPCIVGCGSLLLNEKNMTLSSPTQKIHEGDPISIDGMTGEVYFCNLKTVPSEVLQVLLTHTKKPEESLLYRQFKTVMDLSDKYRTMKVRANADTPQDSAIARAFGAEGIGLCRTEHMFMDTERLNDVRCMFFSTQTQDRKLAIDRLLPYQKKDFIGIFRAMSGLPVTIRLLDPPLHEFMPHTQEELENLAALMNVSPQILSNIRVSLKEQNPMLGHRGCRLGISFPELTQMQARAIFEAAIQVVEEGLEVFPEIIVPLVGIREELIHQKALIDQTAQHVFSETGITIAYSIGTMIELPRAALLANEIAKEAEFFSFGTNDLTQTTFGISRDDSAKFVPYYIKGVIHPNKNDELIHILTDDPFQVIDQEGVGQLIEMAIERGRMTRPDLKCGICGEHGGDPSSVIFCNKLGLDYVSCSPYRIAVARLSAAIANLN